MSSEEKASSSQAAESAPELPSGQTAGAASELQPDPVDSAVGSEKPVESAEIGQMLADMGMMSGFAPGQIVEGRVLKLTDDEVIVDIGLKSEGAIPRSEFLTEDGSLTVQPGDRVDVWIEEYDEQEGTFTVSHRKAARQRAWEATDLAFQEQTTVKGRVIERTKGGLTVDIGVRAFLPASQADMRPLRNLDSLIGQEIQCKIIKLNQARNNAVVSRKLAQEEEQKRRKAELQERLAEGAELVGRVKNLTNYGAFVDLGGMDGLLHVTDLSWGRVGHPSELVQVGQEIRVKVLKYDREKERISLGVKQLAPDPWERVASFYKPGDRVRGRVVSLTDYGAFVEIEPGIEGLIHVSEMTWSRRMKHPSKILNVGDRVDVTVLEVNPSQRRISLSLKQALPDPWTGIAKRLAVGATIEGRVRNLTDFGAFVEIEDGVDGLIHVSDISWNKNVKHPSEALRKGQRVEAVVLALDEAQRRISLGLKQLQPNAWDRFLSRVQAGSVVPGKIVRLAQFGAFVELAEGIEGLCHVSEMDDEHSRAHLKVDMELPFRVIRINAEERKIGLSLKGANEHSREPKSEETRVAQPAPSGLTQMGEKMAEAIRAASAAPPSAREVRSASEPARPAADESDAARHSAAEPVGQAAAAMLASPPAVELVTGEKAVGRPAAGAELIAPQNGEGQASEIMEAAEEPESPAAVHTKPAAS